MPVLPFNSTLGCITNTVSVKNSSCPKALLETRNNFLTCTREEAKQRWEWQCPRGCSCRRCRWHSLAKPLKKAWHTAFPLLALG